ncbi:MAG: phosphatase PAP2 family protein [Candidatus Nomurabacteria bacterium]|nr:phosphatase PAP2 family protein [Candidatus Nomurabacteria bacterium]
MKKFLSIFPIEVYVILLPSIIFFIMIGIKYFNCYLYQTIQCINHSSAQDFISAFLENNIISVILIFVFIYLLFSIILIIYKKDNHQNKTSFNIRSFLFIFGILYISAVAMAFEIKTIFISADPIHTAQVSEFLMHTDKVLFGSYLPFSFYHIIHSNILSQIFYNSYIYLFPIILVIIFISLFSNKEIYRKFLIAYFLAFLISLPIWIKFPAISPDSMYLKNILNTKISVEIQNVINITQISPRMQKNISAIGNHWIDPAGGSLAISTFPSMHAAWGIISVVSIIELWPPVAIIAIPWVVAELIGTMYTLEHYGVDVLFGIIIGFFALWITKRLLKFEKRYFVDSYHLFLIFDHLKQLYKSINNKLGNQIEKITKISHK